MTGWSQEFFLIFRFLDVLQPADESDRARGRGGPGCAWASACTAAGSVAGPAGDEAAR